MNADQDLKVRIALAELHQKCFRDDMRVTLVARHPDYPDRHLVCGDDDLTRVAELIHSKVSDADALIDPVWLRSVGALPDSEGLNGEWSFLLRPWDNDGDGVHLVVRDIDGQATLETYDDNGDTTNSIILNDLPNRGHVRRMCSALGCNLRG